MSLWENCASEALCRAIEAQPTLSTWRQLFEHACESRSEETEGPAIVVAGIVLSIPMEDKGGEDGRQFMCVSLGSGTRCTGTVPADAGDYHVRDGHAEVIARRSFIAYLMDCIEESHASGATEHDFLVKVESGWSLKPDVKVHLVCTHWMCGSMASAQGGGRLLLRTPAGTLQAANNTQEPAVADMDASNAAVVHVRNHVLAAHRSETDSSEAYAHAARVKPGKGHPSLCMSCSDKVWRWSVSGLLGRRWAKVLSGGDGLVPLAEILVVGSPAEAAAASASLSAKSKLCGATTLPPTPKVTALPVDEMQLEPDDYDDREYNAYAGDTSFSCASWLCPVAAVAANDSVGQKRTARSSPTATWRLPTGKGARRVVLNMKAGLPQGASAKSLLAAVKDSAWERFPLSREWMLKRLERLDSIGAASLGQSGLPADAFRSQLFAGAEPSRLALRQMLWVDKRSAEQGEQKE